MFEIALIECRDIEMDAFSGEFVAKKTRLAGLRTGSETVKVEIAHSQLGAAAGSKSSSSGASSRGGSTSLPARSAQSQKIEVDALKQPAMTPIVRIGR